MTNSSLKINDIKEWLIDNRAEYQKLKAQEFPPFNNEMYLMYGRLVDFYSYYQFVHQCDTALDDLEKISKEKFNDILSWTRKYRILGADKLLMFEICYGNWETTIGEMEIKISDGLFTSKKPFLNLICFCKIFQHLYWDNAILDLQIDEIEQTIIVEELNTILSNFKKDKLKV